MKCLKVHRDGVILFKTQTFLDYAANQPPTHQAQEDVVADLDLNPDLDQTIGTEMMTPTCNTMLPKMDKPETITQI